MINFMKRVQFFLFLLVLVLPHASVPASAAQGHDGISPQLVHCRGVDVEFYANPLNETQCGAGIPLRLMKGGKLNTDEFNLKRKVAGKYRAKNVRGWYLEDDTARHQDSKWKLKSDHKRGYIASIRADGTIIKCALCR